MLAGQEHPAAGGEREVARMRRGDVLGDAAVVFDDPWPGTLEATSDGCELAEVPRKAVEALLLKRPEIAARMDALEGRIADQTQAATRLDQLSARVDALGGRSQSSADQLKQQLDAANSKITSLQASSTSVATAGSRVDRLMRLEAASVALANGRPLGNIPDAPPAVARFAEKPPPTEAQLRLAFDQVQHDILTAAKPDNDDKPFLDRVLGKAEELVSIRRGNEVVIGHSTVAALAHADAAVQAGDFPAALKAIGEMDASAQKAAAGWVAQVKSLLDARAALADMAAHA